MAIFQDCGEDEARATVRKASRKGFNLSWKGCRVTDEKYEFWFVIRGEYGFSRQQNTYRRIGTGLREREFPPLMLSLVVKSWDYTRIIQQDRRTPLKRPASRSSVCQKASWCWDNLLLVYSRLKRRMWSASVLRRILSPFASISLLQTHRCKVTLTPSMYVAAVSPRCWRLRHETGAWQVVFMPNEAHFHPTIKRAQSGSRLRCFNSLLFHPWSWLNAIPAAVLAWSRAGK